MTELTNLHVRVCGERVTISVVVNNEMHTDTRTTCSCTITMSSNDTDAAPEKNSYNFKYQ